jgi:rRNA maturation endonuclease Nob1
MISSTSRLVLDSTVIIALSTVKQVELLRWRVLIPEKVVEELSREPARSALAYLLREGKAEVMKPLEEMRKKALSILGDKEEMLRLLEQLASSWMPCDMAPLQRKKEKKS